MTPTYSQNGLTLLMKAIEKGNTNIVELLLKCKADSNERNQVTLVRPALEMDVVMAI